MRKPYLIGLVFPLLLGAAPSRTQTYTAGEVIDPAEVTENENNIYDYLQAGVDTIRANSVETGDLQDSSVTTAKIGSGAVTNAGVSASAAIDFSKLASLTSANILVGSSGNVATSVAMSGDITISNTGVVTIGANTVTLTTDTTGNYVATIADSGSSTVTVSGSGSEGAAVTLNVVDVNCSNCIDGTDIAVGSDAQGDILYYSGTDWVRLGAGTDGQYLETNGAGQNPTWTAIPLAEAGRVDESISANGGSANGTDVSITTDVQSRVLVILTGYFNTLQGTQAIEIRRDATDKETIPAATFTVFTDIISMSWSETLAAGTYAFDVELTDTGSGQSDLIYHLEVLAVPI